MRLSKSLQLTVGVLIFVLVAGLVMAAGPYKLAFRMKKGQRLTYKMKMALDQSVEMMGQEMTSTVNNATTLRLEVEEVSKDGKITFVYAVDSLQAHVKNAMMRMDSIFKNPDGLIGKRTRITIMPNGKRVSSVVVDSVKLAPMMMQLLGSRQNSFGFVELPDKELKPGDSWTHDKADTIAQGSGQIVIGTATTYTVAGEVDTLGYKCLRLASKGKTTLKGEGEQMGAKLFFEGEGPTSGAAYFAVKEGLLVAVVSDADLEATIAVTGPQNMTIPQTTSTKTSLVLVK